MRRSQAALGLETYQVLCLGDEITWFLVEWIACLLQAGTLLGWFTGQKEISESSCESLEYSMNYIQVLQHREMSQMVQANEISEY